MDKIFLFSFITSFSLFACQKEEISLVSGEDLVIIETAIGDVFRTADEQVKNEDLFRSLSSCAMVTISPFDTVTFPKTVIIDFGPINCLGTDGRYRRGKININMSDRYRNTGSQLTIIPENYYVNDYQVMGNHTLINNGINTNGNISFTASTTDAKVIAPNADEILWNSTRTNEWIEGYATTSPLDDVYSITGTGNGVNHEGTVFNVLITSALIKEIFCRWIKKGTIEISNADGQSALIDYGNGTCDDQATLTIGSKTININLK